MKFVLALLVLIAPAFAADPKAEKEVLALTETWRQAMLKGDAAVLEKLYHPDITYSHSTAKTEMKAEAIANATGPGMVLKGLELRNIKVRVFGNTATVKSQGDFTTAAGVVNHLDSLMVWVKTGKDWQLIARQSTKLPE
jgi:ketosteroid isomerase-like protein